MYYKHRMKSTVVLQKKRGRPLTREGEYDPVTAIRLSANLGKAIDKWAEANGVRGRSEAIRRLVEQALAGEKAKPKRGRKEKSA